MDHIKIKGIPYGVSDYGMLRKGYDYYVDKTHYLPLIEKSGRYLFFIRPRRFGKSLFLSMMHYYYDVCCKDRFDELFQGTYIHQNPTEERNQYMVLSFNFSEIAPDSAHLEGSFLDLVRGEAVSFISRYKQELRGSEKLAYYSQQIEAGNAPADILRNLNRLVKEAKGKLYVIIDEYDNFANTVLTDSGEQAYRDLTHGEGFFRSFFNVLKGGTGGINAPISRLFITGVSPVTMDDVTSGFNIGKNVSLNPALNKMLGFTRNDVLEMLQYYKVSETMKLPVPDILQLMGHWYGNYLFSQYRDEKLYNSDMVFYFIDRCLALENFPDNLIDRNVRIDYGKLRHLIILDKSKGTSQGRKSSPVTNGNFSILKQIIADNGTTAKLVEGFPLETMTDTDNFISLLFYFGLLTIEAAEKDKLRLTIPNETARRLYFDYIKEAYRETGVFALDLTTYSNLMTDLAYDGKWEPLFQFFTGRMKESLGLRDLVAGEKAVQTFLNVYLGLTDLFIVHSEKELNNGFADLVMEPFHAKYPGMGYSYLLELKYLKAGLKADSSLVKKAITSGTGQLERYALDEKFAKTVGKTKLIKLLLIFSGHKAVHLAACK
ncbi:MAG: AAA family ATPase [bacterium]|nr:AAA family ATPase [bacterium]